jgi:hypothetical protein
LDRGDKISIHNWDRGDLGKGQLRTPKIRWDNNIDMNIRETGYKDGKWMEIVLNDGI